MKSIFLLAVIAACSAEPAPAHPVAPADPHEAIVTRLVGVWSGTAEGTPYGDFPMGLAFERRADGSVHARLDGQPGQYLGFVFHHRDGAWVLTEEGVTFPALPSTRRRADAMSRQGEKNVSGQCANLGLPKARVNAAAETHPVRIPIGIRRICGRR